MEGVPPYNSSDQRLNPESPDFDSKLWFKNLGKIQMSDKDYYRPEELSMAFRNLRARGVAADMDYKPTVLYGAWKYVMDGIDYFRKHNDSWYFNILKSMDGYVRAGEVTAVLERPGSGCSTLLKTVSASTYGFEIADESKITYDGIINWKFNLDLEVMLFIYLNWTNIMLKRPLGIHLNLWQL